MNTILRRGSLLLALAALLTWSAVRSAAAQPTAAEPVATQPTAGQVVSLRELEAIALRSRPTLDAGEARSRAAAADIDKAQSAYYPSLAVEAQSSLAPGRTLITVMDVKGDEYLVQGARALNQKSSDGANGGGNAFTPQLRNELGLQLKGNLYDFGRTPAALAASRAAHASSQAEEDAIRLSIVRGVRGAYLTWLGTSELHAIARDAAADAQARRERVETLIGEGVRPSADLSPARTDEMLAKLELERARGDLSGARLGLELAVGAPLPERAEPDRGLLQSSAAPVQGKDDAGLRALQLKQRAASAAAHAAEKTDDPLLAGIASAGVRTQGGSVFPAYSIGVSLALPLWDGGTAKASAGAARAHADELGALMREHEQEARGALERAHVDADNAGSRLDMAQALLELATQRVHEAEQAYDLGAGSLDQLAQSRSLVRRAKTEIVLAEIARADASLRVAAR